MKLTDHQKRVLAAILALEKAHGLRWWDRASIGMVVGAGGYHETIQLKTIAALKKHGLVYSERSSWPESVTQLVKCGCSIFNWGLTQAGRDIAVTLKICWSDEALKRLDSAGWWELASHSYHLDEVEQAEAMAKRWDDLDDEDDDGGGDDLPHEPTPTPAAPASFDGRK